MDKEGKFYVAITLVLVLGFIGSIAVGTSYWTNHNTKVVQLIKSGVSGVEAMCALQDDYGSHPTCIILATKSN